MSKASRPWMKFYPADWRSDPALRVCSPAAKGLWIDLLCLMHEAEPYGHLLINGRIPTQKELQVVLSLDSKTTRLGLKELEKNGVFSRQSDGTIYSRRMVRDLEKLEKDRQHGREGGNPRLKAWDNGGVNPPDKAQIPDARSQTPEIKKIYGFVGKVIRLTQADYDTWKRAYHAIPDFDAELRRIDDSLTPGEKWFPKVSAMLAAKHQKLLAEKAEKAAPPKMPFVGGRYT